MDNLDIASDESPLTPDEYLLGAVVLHEFYLRPFQTKGRLSHF